MSGDALRNDGGQRQHFGDNMILRCYNCDGATIDLSEHIAVLEIEPPLIFRNVLADLLTADFPAREVAIEREGKLLKATDVCCISDFMEFSPANRTVLGKLYKHLDETLRQDPLVRLKIDNLIAALRSGLEEPLRDFCIDFSVNDTVDYKDLFGAFKLLPACSSDSVGEKLEQFLSLCSELSLFKVIALVQPKAYMNESEITRVYSRALSSRIGMIVVDSTIREEVLPHEKKICIGRDYSDIMI